jgi:hypothetical protein
MSEPARFLLFLRPRQLAIAFRDDRLHDRNKYHLVLLGSGLQLVFGQGFLFTSRAAGNTQLFLIALAIMVWGIRASYKVNSRGDGRAFVERYVCLSVPISIYATLAYLIAAFVIRGLTGSGAATSGPALSLAWFGFSVSTYVAVYLALRFYIGIASSASVQPGDGAIGSVQ